MHKVRNHTPSYASLRRSCDFFMSTQPEYADNFGVEGTRDNATVCGPCVKGALGIRCSLHQLLKPTLNTCPVYVEIYGGKA